MHEMTWTVFLANGAIIATIVSTAITLSGFFNGKHVKRGVAELRALHAEMQIQTEQIVRRTEELLARSDEIARLGAEASQAHREASQAYREGALAYERMEARAEERHRDVLARLRTA